MLTVAAFYKFVNFAGFAAHRGPLRETCDAHGVKGTVLLAAEGVNGTICGTRQGVNAVLGALRALPGFSDLETKESQASEMPFRKMKVRLKQEIVTMGVADLNPAGNAGTYVMPKDWNALIGNDDVAVIDTRNAYEVAIGSFENAINPDTTSFRDFPGWLERFKQQSGAKALAMYCTGGIRCEKATALAKAVGFDEVYHLRGGILSYLEQVPKADSKWQGECYVFDDRVSVGHGLREGDYEMCRACGLPVSPDDRTSSHFAEGISCPACWQDYSEKQKAGFAERQRQYEARRRRIGKPQS